MTTTTSIVQHSWNAGEIGPLMRGRVDADLYLASGQLIDNWMMTPHGALVKRPGFKFLYNMGAASAAQTRFLKFSFNIDQQYLLAFYHQKIAIFRDGEYKTTINTPYSGAHLQDIRIAANGDTIIIVHQEYAPRQLRRQGSDTSWSLSLLTYVEHAFIEYDFSDTTITPSAVTGSGITLTASAALFDSTWTDTRIRLNQGQVTITEYVSATEVKGNVTRDLVSTDADKAFEESCWSAHRGYPRSVLFHGDRLLFGGFKSDPALVAASKTGLYFDFDTHKVKVQDEVEIREITDDCGFTFRITSGDQLIIRDMRSAKNLFIFSSEAELVVTGSNGGPIVATEAPLSKVESLHGISRIPTTEIDGEIVYATRDNKSIRALKYDYSSDSFKSESKTILAHHLFDSGTMAPRSHALLRNFKTTQSNLLFVCREDGTMCVMIIDAARSVLGWCRWTTEGKFKQVCVVASAGADGVVRDTLYALVERDHGLFLEELTIEDVYVDNHYLLTSTTAKTAWTGATALANLECTCLSGGLVHVPVTVASNGSFELTKAVKAVHIGLPYTATAVTQELVVMVNGRMKRGLAITKVHCFVQLLNTSALTVDNTKLPFRFFGNDLLGQPLTPFSGTKKVTLSGRDDTPKITFTSAEPLPATILSIATDVTVSDA